MSAESVRNERRQKWVRCWTSVQPRFEFFYDIPVDVFQLGLYVFVSQFLAVLSHIVFVLGITIPDNGGDAKWYEGVVIGFFDNRDYLDDCHVNLHLLCGAALNDSTYALIRKIACAD
jgi:hypothetical protein